jgi:hypothetical protein
VRLREGRDTKVVKLRVGRAAKRKTATLVLTVAAGDFFSPARRSCSTSSTATTAERPKGRDRQSQIQLDPASAEVKQTGI